jgi:hypothetical protein
MYASLSDLCEVCIFFNNHLLRGNRSTKVGESTLILPQFGSKHTVFPLIWVQKTEQLKLTLDRRAVLCSHRIGWGWRHHWLRDNGAAMCFVSAVLDPRFGGVHVPKFPAARRSGGAHDPEKSSAPVAAQGISTYACGTYI